MGQVSVFGGETVKPELESRLLTCDNYDYYFRCELNRDIFGIIEYPWGWFYLRDIHYDHFF